MPFISSCVIAVARTSSTMLNRRGESGHSCLKGSAYSSCLLSMMLAVGLSYMTFIMFRCVSSIPTLMRGFFYHKWVLDFIKSFFCIYWYNLLVFILPFVYVVNQIYRFVNLVLTLHSQNKSYLIMVYDHFDALLYLVC